MKTIKAKLLGTRGVRTHKPIIVEFVTYIPKTNIKHATSHMSSTYRGIK